MNRRLCTHLHSFFPSVENVFQQKQGISKDKYVAHAKLRHFETNDSMCVHDYRIRDKWMAAVSKEKTGPVSYQCELGNNFSVKNMLIKYSHEVSAIFLNQESNHITTVEAAEPQVQQAEHCQTLPPKPARTTEAE